MSIIKYILILFFTISFVYAEHSSNSDELLKVGYMSNNIYTTKKESKIGAKLWKKEMKNRGFNVDLIEIETDEKALDLFKRKEIYYLTSDGLIYYKYKKKMDELIDVKWLISRNNQKFYPFYLIKNRKSNFDFKNLSKQKIYYKEQMAKIWFEYLLLKRGIKADKIISKMQKVKKDKNLIFNSFFNENNISILSKSLYDSMYELNPQIKEKVEIIEMSETIFFHIMGISRKDLKKSIQERIKLMGDEVREEDSLFETFSFVKAQKIFNLEKDDLKQTDAFFEEYNKLKKLSEK